MGKRFWTRQEIQDILETNNLPDCYVTYKEREVSGQYGVNHHPLGLVGNPANIIVYDRGIPTSSIKADDVVHMKKATLEVTHFYKNKLDSIDNLMLREFNTEPYAFDWKESKTDYFMTMYRFDIFTWDDWELDEISKYDSKGYKIPPTKENPDTSTW